MSEEIKKAKKLDERPRWCPECGTDTYFARNFDRVRDKSYAIEEQLRRMCASYGVDRANWELEKIDRDQNKRWLQRKVDSQRKVINRLENKLLSLKKQPYTADEEGYIYP